MIAFDQPHPVALRTMLQQMEEMLGIPIDMSAMTAGQLDQTVTLHQEQTSMGAILQGLLDGAGLTFHADPLRGIIIAPSRAEQGEGERADKYEK